MDRGRFWISDCRWNLRQSMTVIDCAWCWHLLGCDMYVSIHESAVFPLHSTLVVLAAFQFENPLFFSTFYNPKRNNIPTRVARGSWRSRGSSRTEHTHTSGRSTFSSLWWLIYSKLSLTLYSFSGYPPYSSIILIWAATIGNGHLAQWTRFAADWEMNSPVGLSGGELGRFDVSKGKDGVCGDVISNSWYDLLLET